MEQPETASAGDLNARVGSWPIFLLSGLLYGGCVFALLPPNLVPLNDDFAYIRSVVATLQHGRPWTDAWLEPWAAGLSTIAALIFKVTGSFLGATHGVMAVGAAWSFVVGCALLERRGLNPLRAMLVTALGLTVPTVFWKQLQFTGLVLYLPCLLTALWAIESRRWGSFLVVWTLAFATRQSALVWGVLPVVAMAQKRPIGVAAAADWSRVRWVLIAGAAMYGLLALGMNKTMAQRNITEHLGAAWNMAQASRAVVTCSVVFLCFRGLALGVCGQWDYARGRWLRIGCASGAIILWLHLDPQRFVACEFETYSGGWASVYLRGIGVLAILALCGSAWRLNWAAVAGGVAATVLLTLRPMLWDYYLLDVALMGAWSVSVAWQRGAFGHGVWRVAAAGLLGIFQIFGVVQVKSVLDRTHVMTELGSRAVEGGRLSPSDASVLPFGLMAWYFFPYYAAHEGKNSSDLADFGCYLAHDTTLVAWRFSRSLRSLPHHEGGIPDPPSGEPIIRGRFRYFWIYDVDVLMYRNAPERVIPARVSYPHDYRLPPFPHDDAGWRALIEGRDPAP